MWTCECLPVYMHVCACVLGDKSQKWVMDSPGVSMMVYRRWPPRNSVKVGHFQRITGSVMNLCFSYSQSDSNFK